MEMRRLHGDWRRHEIGGDWRRWRWTGAQEVEDGRRRRKNKKLL